MNKLRKLLAGVTCQEVSVLASHALEGQLSIWDRLGLYIHLTICPLCKRFFEQLKFIRKASRQKQEKTSPGSHKLPPQARERIRRKLRQG